MQNLGSTYLRVVEVLREKILDGRMAPSSRLPTEMELCRQLGVSRITIRRALQILEDESLVIRRQGSGTYVSPKPCRKVSILNSDFAKSIRRHAPQLKRKLEKLQWLEADLELSERLGVMPGQKVLYARRHDQMMDQMMAVDELYLLEFYGKNMTEADLMEIDLLAVWQHREGIRMDMAKQIVEAIPATSPQNQWLGVELGTPLLYESNFFYLDGNRLAGACWTYYHGRHFQMTTVFREPSPIDLKRSQT